MKPLRIGFLGVLFRPFAARSFRKNKLPIFLGLIFLLSILPLSFVQYHWVHELRSRTEEALTESAQRILSGALDQIEQDMMGAHLDILLRISHSDINNMNLAPVLEILGSNAKKYPYIDKFFVYKSTNRKGLPEDGSGVLFYDPDLPIPMTESDSAIQGSLLDHCFRRIPQLGRAVVCQGRLPAEKRCQWAIAHTELEGVPYQLVLHPLYEHAESASFGTIGFIVNLDDVRQEYFARLFKHQIGVWFGGEGGAKAVLTIRNEEGEFFSSQPHANGAPDAKATLPVVFAAQHFFQRPAEIPVGYPVWEAGIHYPGESASSLARKNALSNLAMAFLAVSMVVVGWVMISVAVSRQAKVSEMKSDFLSRVSHELKTPVSVIHAYAETLAAGRASDPHVAREYHLTIQSESERLAELIDQILHFSRMKSEECPFRFRKVEPRIIMERVIELFHPRLEESGFELEVDIRPDLPRVHADPQAISEAVGNLLDNAVKYSRVQRWVGLKVWSEHGKILIEVADRGIGIGEGDRELVFGRFYRASGKEIEETRGVGLGLPIVRHVIEAHGGGIRLDSQLGVGSRFTLSLPATMPLEHS
jgi:signal transduction histidine kinase